MKRVPDAPASVWHYSHSGLVISSDLQLPEWSQCRRTAEGEPPDASIFLKTCRHSDSDGAPLISAGEYRLRVPKVGHLYVRDGREIHVELLPSAETARVRPWLLNLALGVLCYQRGLFILHASAVRIGGEAVLLCGPPGRGKSTLAAQLGSRGHAIIGDDLCRLDLPSQRPPAVYPSGPRLKLWSDALVELGLRTHQLTPDYLREGKFHLSLYGQGLTHSVPVRAAYSLAWGDYAVRPLHGMAAFRGFIGAATWRRRLLESMGQIDAHYRNCMELLQRVPFAELTRPRDFAASGTTLDYLVGRESSATV